MGVKKINGGVEDFINKFVRARGGDSTGLDAATAAVSASSLDSSEDLIQIMPKIIEGSQGKLATVGLSNSSETIKVINVIGNSLVKSINGRSSNLPSASAESGSTATETVLKKITSTSVANLDEAGLSSTDIGTASSELVPWVKSK